MTQDEVMETMAALVEVGWSADEAEEVAEAMWRAGAGLSDEWGRWMAVALASLTEARRLVAS